MLIFQGVDLLGGFWGISSWVLQWNSDHRKKGSTVHRLTPEQHGMTVGME